MARTKARRQVERSNTATPEPLVCLRCNIDPLDRAALESTRSSSSHSPSGKQAADHTQSRAHTGARQRSDPEADPPHARAEGSAYASLASSTSQTASSPPALRAIYCVYGASISLCCRALGQSSGPAASRGDTLGICTRAGSHRDRRFDRQRRRRAPWSVSA